MKVLLVLFSSILALSVCANAGSKTVSITAESLHDGCVVTVDVRDYVDCLYTLGDPKAEVKVNADENLKTLIEEVSVTEQGDLLVRYNAYYDKSYFDLEMPNTMYMEGVKVLQGELDEQEISIEVTSGDAEISQFGEPKNFGQPEDQTIGEAREASQSE